MFRHTCQICGKEFESLSNRAKYCHSCRNEAQNMRDKVYRERKRAELSIPLGSNQICPVCGEMYTVVSGSQKRCKACAKKLANAGKQQPTAEYIKEKYDYIRFHVPKDEGEKIRAYAQEHGMTIKALMLAALKEYQKNNFSFSGKENQ